MKSSAFLIRAILFLNLIAVLGPGYGQTVRFRHYSVDEGFTGVAFKSMAQDSLGYLWIGTHTTNDVLFKFDGYNFHSYTRNPSDSLSIPSVNSGGGGGRFTHPLWIGPSGQLFAAFADAVAWFDPKLDGFVRHPLALDGEMPTASWFENGQVVWLGSGSKGLMRCDLSQPGATYYPMKTPNGDAISIKDIKDWGDALLIASSKGLWQFDKSTRTYYQNLKSGDEFANVTINKIFRDQNSCWFWTSEGLVKVDLDFRILQSLLFEEIDRRFDYTNSYSDAAVVSIDHDAADNFWIASEGLGLIRFNPSSNDLTNFRYDKEDPNSLPSDVLSNVMIDRNQNVWVATLPKGIALLKKPSLQFYNHMPGKATAEMAMVGAHQVFVGTNGNGLWEGDLSSSNPGLWNFRPFEIKPSASGLRNLIKIRAGKSNLWMGTLNNGVMGLPLNPERGTVSHQIGTRYSPIKDNPNSLALSIVTTKPLEDQDGNLWVGTISRGLFKIVAHKKYGEAGSVIRFDHTTSAIKGDNVGDVMLDDDNNLWVGNNSGLELYRDGNFEQIFVEGGVGSILRTRDGFLMVSGAGGLHEGRMTGKGYTFSRCDIEGDISIKAMAEDKLGRLWCLTTSDGIVFYDRVKRLSIKFKKDDGLPSSRALPGGGVIQTPGGMMIFSNSEGITAFDPLSLQISSVKPHPRITELKINNKVVDVRNPDSRFGVEGGISTLTNLELDHTHNIFSFEFSSMDLTAPEKTKFKYQLENFDPDWVSTDWRNRTATYSNLKPGDYVFKVKATNQDGIWGDDVRTLNIHVLPPPWRSWWAYSGYGLLILLALVLARRNIVQRERLKANLALARVEQEKEHFELEKVKEVDRIKTSFFTNISHEFRTPLTLIKGPAQDLMEKYKEDAKTQEKLMLIQRNSDLLLKLINQLLNLARLESGELKLEPVEFELGNFVRTLCSSFSTMARQKNITLTVEPPAGNHQVLFDKDKLETVFINLINNAIKFTPPGGAVDVNVAFQSAPQFNGKSESKLILTVKDNGIGIRQEQQDKIFERFYQVSDSHKEVGTGVGLSLVKELVNLFRGTISVRSAIGQGSTFLVEFPIKVTHLQRAVTDIPSELVTVDVDQPDGSHAAEELSAKPLILVVEDNYEMRKFIVESLGSDYNFLEAPDGKQGLDIAFREVPKLIISDVMMPEMDGIDMAARIKHDVRTSHIPIILLTAKVTEESHMSGLGTGADDYITKPFNRLELQLKVRNAINSREKLHEKIRLEFLNNTPKLEVQSADEAFLMKVRETIQRRLSDEQLGVESLADEIGLSRVQLYRKITALTGISVNEMIRMFRLQRAAQLLKQHWGTMSQVAYEVGFSSPSYFSKCFRDHFGVMPSEYSQDGSNQVEGIQGSWTK